MSNTTASIDEGDDQCGHDCHTWEHVDEIDFGRASPPFVDYDELTELGRTYATPCVDDTKCAMCITRDTLDAYGICDPFIHRFFDSTIGEARVVLTLVDGDQVSWLQQVKFEIEHGEWVPHRVDPIYSPAVIEFNQDEEITQLEYWLYGTQYLTYSVRYSRPTLGRIPCTVRRSEAVSYFEPSDVCFGFDPSLLTERWWRYRPYTKDDILVERDGVEYRSVLLLDMPEWTDETDPQDVDFGEHMLGASESSVMLLYRCPQPGSSPMVPDDAVGDDETLARIEFYRHGVLHRSDGMVYPSEIWLNQSCNVEYVGYHYCGHLVAESFP